MRSELTLWNNTMMKQCREGYKKILEPLVSVIMPSYNAESYIGQAIESILYQTYENWELIIIEDASTDRSMDVIRSYEDDRIKVYCNGYNRGIAASTNRGIDECHGKYVALLDDDDIAEKKRLELQVNYLEQHLEIDILGGRTTYIDSQGELIDYAAVPRYNPRYIKAMLLFNCMDFMNSTAMIRKNFIVKNRLLYHDGCYGMQDFRFYMESSKVGNLSTIKDFVLRHRMHENNTTKKMTENFKEERAKVYAQLQRDSLYASGFRLNEASLTLVNKVLAEFNGKCDSLDELVQLYEILQELLKQGRKMEIDYYDEMSHVCRTKIAKQVIEFKNLFDYKKR